MSAKQRAWISNIVHVVTICGDFNMLKISWSENLLSSYIPAQKKNLAGFVIDDDLHQFIIKYRDTWK